MYFSNPQKTMFQQVSSTFSKNLPATIPQFNEKSDIRAQANNRMQQLEPLARNSNFNMKNTSNKIVVNEMMPKDSKYIK